MRLQLIYNAHAGPVQVRPEIESVKDYLEGKGCEVALAETSASGMATQLARDAAAQGFDAAVAVGGDGTVNEVACGLVGTETALGVLPVGTTNVWAIQMHIPALNPIGVNTRLARLLSDLGERIDRRVAQTQYRSVLLNAAKVLVEGQTVRVDVGQTNDRHFLLWSGIGLDAEVTENVTPEQKRQLGPLAFVGTTFDTLRDYKSVDVTLVIDGQSRRVNTALIIVSNIQLYGGILPLGARAAVNDGKLDVCVFHGEGIAVYLQHVLRIASRQHVDDPNIEYYQGQEIVVQAEKPLLVHVDDEPFAHTPVTIRVVPHALNVILPRDVPKELFV
ncbi:MAG: diacylglycerol kinase family lipid kinase [Anaerolineae bacterium]|nr:diacylglycerol kinase family lipid kinase [Anaerolineae bacterium]